MPLWFLIVSAAIAIGAIVFTNYVFDRIAERQVERLRAWEDMTHDEQLRLLRDMKVETVIAQGRTWRILVALLIVVVWFVPSSLVLIGLAVDETNSLADRNALAVANTEYESCTLANEVRLYSLTQQQEELDHTRATLTEEQEQPPFDMSALIGFDQVGPGFQRLLTEIEDIIATEQAADIEHLTSEVTRLEDALAQYEVLFPLQSCGDDPI